QFPFDIPTTTSPPLSKTSPYYSSESPYIIPTTDHSSPYLSRSPISSPSSVSHLSPTSQTSLESSNGQPSPVSATLIPTPPPPPLSPPSPPITRQRPTNLCQNPKQWVPYNPFVNHASVLPTTITEPTSFTSANNSPENLKEQVYRKQPLGFIDPQRPNHVCFLHKSFYGLKKASRAWFECLSKALFDLGFKGSKSDPSLFIYSRRHTLMYILVYVDNIIITGNNKGTIDNIICQLGSAFALKDIRPLNYFLGIEIGPHVSDILLSQKMYILELLQSAGLSNCKLVSSPMVTLSLLNLDDIKRILRYLHGMVKHEANYKALVDIVAELTWLQALLNELGIHSSSTPILWCDNLGATYLSANPTFHITPCSVIFNNAATDDTQRMMKMSIFGFDLPKIALQDLSDPVFSHKDIDKDVVVYFRKVVQFYEDL
nr:reverse transcriptase, RNA-dependent DNA polymerase [Tanacetum cinerariifolium]